MFGQKSREREMYISEHVAHIRHRPTMVGCSTYTSFCARLCVSSPFFFSFFFFSTTREYIQNNTQRVNRRANSFVGSFVSLFLTLIVVYYRQKIRRSLSYFCWLYFNLYQKEINTKINLVNFTKIHNYTQRKKREKYTN